MLLIRISLLVAALANQQDFQTLAQHAVQLQQQGNYVEAATAYRELLKLDPTQVATHVNLAIVLVNLGQYDEAISEYQAADKLLPNDPRIAANLGLAYEKSGRLQQAAQVFDELHTANPQDVKTTMLLADANLQLGNDARVVQLLQPLAGGIDDPAFNYMLGMALLHQHRTQEAQVLLDRILRNGDSPQAHFLLGTRMFESGDFPAAVKELATAAGQAPNLPQVQSLYGRALLNTGDPDSAAAAFRKELAQHPGDYDSCLGLAQILVVRKQYAEAQPLAERALAARPDSAEGKLLLAEALAGLGDLKRAQPYAEAATAAMPQSIEAHQTLAATLGDTPRGKQETQTVQKLVAAMNAAEPGPKLNQNAPDFTLPRSGAPGTVSLHDYEGKSPVVLVFGSYSCPNFRDSADILKSLQHRFGARVPFLLVYIREAHSTVDWKSTRNAGVTLAPAASMEQKEDHAALCSRKLHLDFPAVIDGMDDKTEEAYNAWPSRAFVIDRSGKVVYSSRLTELDFHANEMEQALQKVATKK